MKKPTGTGMHGPPPHGAIQLLWRRAWRWQQLPSLLRSSQAVAAGGRRLEGVLAHHHHRHSDSGWR